MFVTYRKVTMLMLSLLFCFMQKMFAMQDMQDGGAASRADDATPSEVIYNEGFFRRFSAEVFLKLLGECMDEDRRLNDKAFERICTEDGDGSLFSMYYETLKGIDKDDTEVAYLYLLDEDAHNSDASVRPCSFQWQLCNALYLGVRGFMSLVHVYQALHKRYARCFEAVGEGSLFLDTRFPLCVLFKNIYEKQQEQGLSGKQALQEETVKRVAELLYAISFKDAHKFTESAEDRFGGKSRMGDAGTQNFGGEGPRVCVQIIYNTHVHKHYHQEDSFLGETERGTKVEEPLLPQLTFTESVHEESKIEEVAEEKVLKNHWIEWRNIFSRLAFTLGHALLTGLVSGPYGVNYGRFKAKK